MTNIGEFFKMGHFFTTNRSRVAAFKWQNAYLYRRRCIHWKMPTKTLPSPACANRPTRQKSMQIGSGAELESKYYGECERDASSQTGLSWRHTHSHWTYDVLGERKGHTENTSQRQLELNFPFSVLCLVDTCPSIMATVQMLKILKTRSFR